MKPDSDFHFKAITFDEKRNKMVVARLHGSKVDYLNGTYRWMPHGDVWFRINRKKRQHLWRLYDGKVFKSTLNFRETVMAAAQGLLPIK